MDDPVVKLHYFILSGPPLSWLAAKSYWILLPKSHCQYLQQLPHGNLFKVLFWVFSQCWMLTPDYKADKITAISLRNYYRLYCQTSLDSVSAVFRYLWLCTENLIIDRLLFGILIHIAWNTWLQNSFIACTVATQLQQAKCNLLSLQLISKQEKNYSCSQ